MIEVADIEEMVASYVPSVNRAISSKEDSSASLLECISKSNSSSVSAMDLFCRFLDSNISVSISVHLCASSKHISSRRDLSSSLSISCNSSQLSGISLFLRSSSDSIRVTSL